MYTRDYRDIVGGGVLAIVGIAVEIYVWQNLTVGTVRNMGPGMVPAALGFLLFLLGLGVCVPALRRPGEPVDFEFRPFVAVFLSILAFALVVDPFGMIPAAIVQTAIVSRADNTLTLRQLVLLAVSLAVLVSAMFEYLLGLQLKALSWPW
jgi:hypothetical protein